MSGLAVSPRLSDSFQISKKIPRKSSGFREQVGLGPLLSKAQNPNIGISDYPIFGYSDISMLSEIKKNLKAVIRYSHISLFPMLSKPANCTLYTAQHTMHHCMRLLQQEFCRRINQFSSAVNHISCCCRRINQFSIAVNHISC